MKEIKNTNWDGEIMFYKLRKNIEKEKNYDRSKEENTIIVEEN